MRRKYLALIAVCAAVALADQATKYLAVAHLTNAFEAHDRTTFGARLAGFFSLKNLDNQPYVSGEVDHRKPPSRLIDGWWHHKYVENPGAAWGLLSDLDPRIRVPFFHLVSLVAIAFILLFYRRLEADQRLLGAALSLVLGGALGNYFDRLVRNYVIDFVDWHWAGRPDLHWPTFNLADAAITAGVALMLADALLSPVKAPDAGVEPAAAAEGVPERAEAGGDRDLGGAES